MRAAHAVLLCVALCASSPAFALTKVDEGFTTGLTRDGRALKRVHRAQTDDPVYYWLQFKDHKPGKSSARCVVRGGPKGETLVDETEQYDDDDGEGFLFCGVDGDENELEPGTYTFTHYLNGEQVGELSLLIEKRPFWRISLYRKFKWALGALALVIIGIPWLLKKFRGDKSVEGAGPRAGVVIGSKVSGAQASAPRPQSPPAPPQEDPLAMFKKRLAADPNFKLARAEDVLPIAKAARSAGDPNTAIAALRGFDKTFPGHSLIPDVYVFSAKLMAEDLKNAAMARKILEHVIAKYPGHHLAQEARNYLKAMPA